MPQLTIGIVAPSSQVPAIELAMGVEALEREGFRVRVHGQVKGSHWFFAGSDEKRAKAFLEFARDPIIDVLWCARGGYGAIRLLPLLEAETRRRGRPAHQKLLVGYSDATALLEFTRQRWGWSSLHGPMPALRRFSRLPSHEWMPLLKWVRGASVSAPWGNRKLKFITGRPQRALRGEVVGGNLSVWNAMIGSSFEGRARDRIVFFEDIDETLPRLDRMVHHLLISGRLKGARAVVLGDFLNCKDAVASVLAVPPTGRNRERLIAQPRPSDLKPLRARLDEKKMLLKIFAQVGEALDIPIAYGLPAGHGPNFSALPLGAQCELTPQGEFEVVDWRWTRRGR